MYLLFKNCIILKFCNMNLRKRGSVCTHIYIRICYTQIHAPKHTEISSRDLIACWVLVLLSGPRISVRFWDLPVPLPKCRRKQSERESWLLTSVWYRWYASNMGYLSASTPPFCFITWCYNRVYWRELLHVEYKHSILLVIESL